MREHFTNCKTTRKTRETTMDNRKDLTDKMIADILRKKNNAWDKLWDMPDEGKDNRYQVIHYHSGSG